MLYDIDTISMSPTMKYSTAGGSRTVATEVVVTVVSLLVVVVAAVTATATVLAIVVATYLSYY